MKCGHIQRNVTALDITQRRGFIWQRRDQVLNPVFDLLVKTTTRPLIYLARRIEIYVFAFARVRVRMRVQERGEPRRKRVPSLASF